ncbi:MAG: energy transducer TonB [Chrysiogenales bacterium]|nr:MAG: energy transducer TonB [Chrysiogenales bacterium]
MFDMFLPGKEIRKTHVRKGLTFSLSLLLHALLIVAIIVVPLLRAEAQLPEFKFIDVLIAPPVLPGVPPGPGRGRKTPTGPIDTTKGLKNPPPTNKPRGFIAPVEIPTEIIDENPSDFIFEEPSGPGVEGGAGDGKTPWIVGKDILPEEVNPLEKAITTIRPPRLIKRVNPVYSQIAISAHVSGSVVIEAVTDIYGRVREARIIRGHALLSASALEAVREWIYEPYLINGIPRPVSFTVTVTFTLEKR